MLIEQFICHEDNFGVLIHDETSGQTAAIDAPQCDAMLQALKRRGWRQLDTIFITHHHFDHTQALEELKTITNAQVYGPAAEKSLIPGLDHVLNEGDVVAFGHQTIEVLATPGHTLGEISFYCVEAGLAFTGDTLFSLGCGRLLEGSPAMMLESLKKLRALPDKTQIYCGHEYTQNNARFALTMDPDNAQLQQRAMQVKQLRQQNLLTLPTTLEQEKATNPFLRWDAPSVRQALAMQDASDLEVLRYMRQQKDNFS